MCTFIDTLVRPSGIFVIIQNFTDIGVCEWGDPAAQTTEGVAYQEGARLARPWGMPRIISTFVNSQYMSQGKHLIQWHHIFGCV